MTDMDLLFAGAPVADLALAVDWYSRLFGRQADVIVNDDEVMWRVSDSAWIYVFRDPGRAGHGTVTLSVRDLDRTIDELAERGIVGEPVEVVGTAGRKTKFADADGNVVDFIELTN